MTFRATYSEVREKERNGVVTEEFQAASWAEALTAAIKKKPVRAWQLHLLKLERIE